MPGRIPWERISGDEAETIIAVYVCRENPDAVKVRPSRGDGGIDLLCKRDDDTYDVYQVKKFATNLSSGQKTQILNSWEKAQKFFDEHHWTMSNWYLVLPLDPTPENILWFKETIQSRSSFKCHWLGLANVEAWASAMPEVYDYYMADGREAVDQRIKSLLKAAQKPDLRDSKELTKKLFEDAEFLSKIDPHYAYSVRLISKYDKNGFTFSNRPNLMYSEIMTNSEGYSVVIEAIAKYKAAPDFSPLKTSCTLYAETPEDKKKLHDFVKYGTPFNELPVKNIKENLKLPALEMQQDEMFSRIGLLGQIDPHPLILVLISDDTHIALEQKSRTSGRIGGEWTGEDKSGAIHIRLRTEANSLETTLEITPHLTSLSGSEVLPAFKAIDFLYTNSQSKNLELQTLHGKSIYSNPTSTNMQILDQETILPWYELLLSLKEIHDEALVDFQCPDFASLNEKQVQRWKEIEHLLKGECVIRHWDTIKICRESDKPVALPAGIAVLSELIATIGTQRIPLGYTQRLLNAAFMDIPKNNENEYILHSEASICDLLIEQKIAIKPEDRDKISHVFIGPLLDLSEYTKNMAPIQ